MFNSKSDNNMRHIFLLLAVAFASTASAQDVPKDYKKMLTDGKVWHCIDEYKYFEGTNDRNLKYTDSICGDTLINGVVGKRIHRVYEDDLIEESFYAMHEKDKKVYLIEGVDNGNVAKTILFDFNLETGDFLFPCIDSDTNIFVERIDTITVKGKEYRRLTFNYSFRGQQACWVEGIGSNSRIYMTLFDIPTGYSFYKYMVSCYKDGKCIFEGEDFATHATGISTVKDDAYNNRKRLYDITGKQINKPRKDEVYIRNGKKILEK